MRQARELGTVEGDYLFQDSKQKLILSGEIPLERAKVFILGAVSGTEACAVSLERDFSLWKARSVECRQCPTRMLRVVGGAAVRGSSQRAPLLSDTGHCRTFPWSPRSFSGCRAGDEAFSLQQSMQELLSVALPCLSGSR